MPRCRLLLNRLCFLARTLAGAASAHAQDWHVQVTPFNQIFPALDLSQSRPHAPALDADGTRIIGSGNGLVAIQLRARHDRESVHLEIASDAWLPMPARLDAVLEQAGVKYELRPLLAWNARKLSTQTQPTPATLRFSLQRDAQPADVRNVDVSLRPLNEALYFVRDGAETVDLSWIFAAFVNENDAVVDRVLALGTQSAIVDGFAGYASASPDDVLRQAWAIWHALSARGIRYSGDADA